MLPTAIRLWLVRDIYLYISVTHWQLIRTNCSISAFFLGVFVDYFWISLLVSIILILVLSFVRLQSAGIFILSIIVIVLLGSLIYLLGHMRTAFREKYADNLYSIKSNYYHNDKFEGINFRDICQMAVISGICC